MVTLNDRSVSVALSEIGDVVICSYQARNDCPIFYMRTKVHKDLVEAQQSLVKFDLAW